MAISKRRAAAVAVGTLLAVFLAPIVWSAFGIQGYYDGGFCNCGYPIYIHMRGDGYYQYSPGHGQPEQLVFTLRQRDNEWVALKGDGNVLVRYRIESGALCESFSRTGAANWTRHARVYNVWRVLVPQLLSR